MANRMRQRLFSAAGLAALVVSVIGMLPAPQRHRPSGLEAGAPVGAPHRPTAAAAVGDTAVFAGGCFWGIEGVFEHLKGVTSAVSGYTGGSISTPSTLTI